MSDNTFGQQLIEAVNEAIHDKSHGRVVHPNLNIAELRKELNLSQKEFADIYHINLETLRNWEQGKRFPDTTSLAYLMCISQDPNAIRKLLKNVA